MFPACQAANRSGRNRPTVFHRVLSSKPLLRTIGYVSVPGLGWFIFTAVFEFEIQKCTRRCAETSRDLKPGDVFYSTLHGEGTQVVRRDYAEEAWKGPPEDAIGWWKSKVPDPSARTVHWAPNDVMLHFFDELDRRQDSQDTRYILTLLMIRRRVVRLEDTEHDEQGREVMVVYCPGNETEYRVSVVTPSPQRIAEIQQELANLLFASAA